MNDLALTSEKLKTIINLIKISEQCQKRFQGMSNWNVFGRTSSAPPQSLFADKQMAIWDQHLNIPQQCRFPIQLELVAWTYFIVMIFV